VVAGAGAKPASSRLRSVADGRRPCAPRVVLAQSQQRHAAARRARESHARPLPARKKDAYVICCSQRWTSRAAALQARAAAAPSAITPASPLPLKSKCAPRIAAPLHRTSSSRHLRIHRRHAPCPALQPGAAMPRCAQRGPATALHGQASLARAVRLLHACAPIPGSAAPCRSRRRRRETHESRQVPSARREGLAARGVMHVAARRWDGHAGWKACWRWQMVVAWRAAPSEVPGATTGPQPAPAQQPC
jgi:hypothetical protein